MKINYNELSFEEMRELAINGELSHLFMTKENYDLLYENEMKLDNPNQIVIDFCKNGYRRFKKHPQNQEENKFDKTLERFGSGMNILEKQFEYKLKPCEELGKMLLNGQLKLEYMSVSVYRLLLDNEMKLKEPNSYIIDFCIEGLKDLKTEEALLQHYIKLSFQELREMILKGTLEHEYMTDDVYGFILYNEIVNKTDEGVNNDVIQFCIYGLSQLKEYNKIILDYAKFLSEKIQKKIKKENMEYSYEELRDMILEGSLKHEYMSKPIYEFLLYKEAKLRIPNLTVLEFCTTGLKRFHKYKNSHESSIWIKAVWKHKAKERSVFRTPQRAAVAAFATFAVILVIGATANAIGYNLIDLSGELIRNIFPNKTSTDYNGSKIIRTDEPRFYNSMSEMLEAENLTILYPFELPNGYEFTDFRVDNSDEYLELQAYGLEPYISYTVMVGVNIAKDNYSYKENGIEYNIAEMNDGLFQADWSAGTDYYMIVVSDKAILSEIINNLKEKK